MLYYKFSEVLTTYVNYLITNGKTKQNKKTKTHFVNWPCSHGKRALLFSFWSTGVLHLTLASVFLILFVLMLWLVFFSFKNVKLRVVHVFEVPVIFWYLHPMCNGLNEGNWDFLHLAYPLFWDYSDSSSYFQIYNQLLLNAVFLL